MLLPIFCRRLENLANSYLSILFKPYSYIFCSAYTETVKGFCPAHVTGFFKAEKNGSLGAGFSIELGVTTDVVASSGSGDVVSVSGYGCSDLSVSRLVLERFRDITGFEGKLEVRHELGVPAGYGLGCSGAAALSLSYALDAELCAGLGRERAALVAHEAEIECRTGLGDVLATYHGGFEIRVSAGGPGRGKITKIRSAGLVAVVACFAPVQTSRFMREKIDSINGLGGKMVRELERGGGPARFQDMSMEFATHVGMDTPCVRRAASALHGAGYGCGVAMVGETVFTLVPATEVNVAVQILRAQHPTYVLVSGVDELGARLEGSA